MKIKSRASMKPANLFFIELIVVLLFFSFSSAVILGIFAAADHRQKHSDLTEKALICSQSLSEAFSVKGDFTEAAAIVFGEGAFDENSAEISLDSDMKPCEDGDVALFMQESHEETKAGRLSSLTFEFRTEDGLLFDPITCEAYFPNKGGAADE